MTLDKIVGLYNKLKPTKEELMCAVPETIASSAFYLPLNVGLETLVSGMDTETSMIARGIGLGVSYIAMPYIMRARNLAKKITHTTKDSSATKKFLTDSGFALVFGISTKAALYTVAGITSKIMYGTEFDYESLMMATGTVAILAATTSGSAFYVMDVFKELTGFKEIKRTPKWLTNKNYKTKKRIATGLILSSIAISGLIYNHNNKIKNKEINNAFEPKTEYIETTKRATYNTGQSELKTNNYYL